MKIYLNIKIINLLFKYKFYKLIFKLFNDGTKRK